MQAPRQPRVCYLVDQETATQHIVSSALKGVNIALEQFDSTAAMLERCTAVPPNVAFIDVTATSDQARKIMDALVVAGFDRPIRIMSGLNGLLTEEIRRAWTRAGLNILPVLTKPLRQNVVKGAVLGLARPSDMPQVSIAEVIDQGWFELWYQPRIDLALNKLAGAEALFRARHPRHGVIPAGDLLEGAEEAELLNLTTRVLGRAMTDWKSLQKIGVPIELSVNVPVCALKRLSLFSIFWEQGPSSPDWPGITLELNEDDVIPNMPFAFAAIKELHKQKIKLALDSFGLGFAELSRCEELPFSEVKIDRSFVCNCDTDPHNAGLCETVVAFAHRYHAKVVAEGVETIGELKTLREMGCDYAQGYLLARPMSKSDFIALLEERARKAAARRSA
jgi:EAL domain-containing protein (putative c-di-GMP-specific phosphodiesterase class I)